MSQSRRHSLAEIVTSTAIGFLVSMALTAVVFPAFGYPVSVSHNAAITAIFTLASVVRGYALRRLFNAWHQQKDTAHASPHAPRVGSDLHAHR